MIPIMNGENDLQYVEGRPYYCPKRVDSVIRLPLGILFLNIKKINRFSNFKSQGYRSGFLDGLKHIRA